MRTSFRFIYFPQMSDKQLRSESESDLEVIKILTIFVWFRGTFNTIKSDQIEWSYSMYSKSTGLHISF